MKDYGAEEIQTIKQIEDEITRLEADIAELKDALPTWHNAAVNLDGSKHFRGKVRRIVLQARKLEQLIKENTFSR